MTGRWLVFDIGCLECAEDSRVVGVFDEREDAEAAREAAVLYQADNWTGQHEFKVFDLEATA